MQENQKKQTSVAIHRVVRKSTARNRRKMQSSQLLDETRSRVRIEPSRSLSEIMEKDNAEDNNVEIERVETPEKHKMVVNANKKMRQMAEAEQNQAQKKITARELKEQAIKKALDEASKMPETKEKKKLSFGFLRALLALTCTATIVFAIVYFANLNASDISLKVVAMQTGIDATYPSYVPRDFNLTGVVSENGKIQMEFQNSETGDAFSLVEEKSQWDSATLLEEFVKKEYSVNYSTVKESGLTIYLDRGNGTWVNGGVIFKVKSISGTLSKKQITRIATSLLSAS